jgi:hypothetical protein
MNFPVRANSFGTFLDPSDPNDKELPWPKDVYSGMPGWGPCLPDDVMEILDMPTVPVSKPEQYGVMQEAADGKDTEF